jgi:hypothetical protein
MRLGEGLTVGEDGSLSVSITPAANQSSCETTDISLLVQAFNQLLAGLKAAGLMEADSVEGPDTGGTDPVTEPTAPNDGNGDGNAAGNDTPAGGDTPTDG